MFVYSIFDSVAELYQGLVLFPNDATAQRWFRSAEMAKNPNYGDFTLVRVGSFDDQNGAIVPDHHIIEKGLKPDEA